MKLKGAKAGQYEAGPNMTPLVDVVMVILIFLMLAGSFGGAEHYLISNTSLSKGGVGVASASSKIDEEVALDVRVDSKTADAFVATAGRISTDDAAKLTEQLRAMREQLIKAGSTDDKIQVKISPGKSTKYRHLVAVYEAAVRADLKKIAFATAH
ncbi:MAG TPA: biopolymer transporter ExbD [Tepidisphaeraceae bacterium]|nr:biopolymer transporter ExbD [Tepidisphaeraceae bacterium]